MATAAEEGEQRRSDLSDEVHALHASVCPPPPLPPAQPTVSIVFPLHSHADRSRGLRLRMHRTRALRGCMLPWPKRTCRQLPAAAAAAVVSGHTSASPGQLVEPVLPVWGGRSIRGEPDTTPLATDQGGDDVGTAQSLCRRTAATRSCRRVLMFIAVATVAAPRQSPQVTRAALLATHQPAPISVHVPEILTVSQGCNCVIGM